MRTTAMTAAAVILALLSLGTQAVPALTPEPCETPTTRLDGEIYESSKALEAWVRAQTMAFSHPSSASYQAAFAPVEQLGVAPDPSRLVLDVVVFDEAEVDPFFGQVYSFKSATYFRVVLERDCLDDWRVTSALRTRTEKTPPDVSMSPAGAPAIS